jgi:hypothetical protein
MQQTNRKLREHIKAPVHLSEINSKSVDMQRAHETGSQTIKTPSANRR